MRHRHWLHPPLSYGRAGVLINAPSEKGDVIVLLDIDSLVFQEVAKGATHVPPSLQGNPEFERLRIVYYFDMRSSLAVVPKVGTSPDQNELIKTRKDMFSALMGQATRLALEQFQARKPFQPPWLEVFVNRYREYMPERLQALLGSVTLKVVHDGYLTARVNKQREILLSSKLKPFLTIWNTLLLTSDVHELHDSLFRTPLGYCLQPATDFSLMRLPVVGAPDTIVFNQVRKITTAQIQFLLLHELGHAYYDHNAITQPQPTQYPWTVIRVEDRDKYMSALESVSIDPDIRPFAKFIAERVQWSMKKAA